MLITARRPVSADSHSAPELLPRPEPLLRTLLGAALRRERQRQRRTLRDVSAAATVSLGYLSEIERGQKEASSELLASICSALHLRVIDVLETLLFGSEGLGRSEASPRHRLETVPVSLADSTREPLQLRAGAASAGASALVNRAA